MEAWVIVEGFKENEYVYGIRYHKLIADRDFKVYKQTLDSRPYKSLTVHKLKCRNQLLRNLCKTLRDLSANKGTGKLAH